MRAQRNGSPEGSGISLPGRGPAKRAGTPRQPSRRTGWVGISGSATVNWCAAVLSTCALKPKSPARVGPRRSTFCACSSQQLSGASQPRRFLGRNAVEGCLPKCIFLANTPFFLCVSSCGRNTSLFAKMPCSFRQTPPAPVSSARASPSFRETINQRAVRSRVCSRARILTSNIATVRSPRTPTISPSSDSRRHVVGNRSASAIHPSAASSNTNGP